jgi:hypothetical protein
MTSDGFLVKNEKSFATTENCVIADEFSFKTDEYSFVTNNYSFIANKYSLITGRVPL